MGPHAIVVAIDHREKLNDVQLDEMLADLAPGVLAGPIECTCSGGDRGRLR
jgi:hypothetical protein